MNTRHKGAIALARAVGHFAGQGYYVFLPVGDNGGDIDLIVSDDGVNVKRVQCKFTESRHRASHLRDPENPVWQVNLRMVKSRAQRNTANMCVYTESSFDLLFVTTPDGDYLLDWADLCQRSKGVPTTIRLGKRLSRYRLTG